MIHCVGCSWTRNWPKFIPGATWEWFDGCGLWAFHESVKSNADTVVVQLPTPIRSYERGSTTEIYHRYITSVLPGREKRLLKRYKREIVELNSLHPNVIFFEFNTAGYPFRAPFDFNCSDEIKSWAAKSGIQWLRLNLSGIPGMCVKEGTEPVKKPWRLINPPGMYVQDGHPSEMACRLAAEYIMENLQ